MKKENIIDWLVIILLVVVLISTCKSRQLPNTMSKEEIKSILDENFDSLKNNNQSSVEIKSIVSEIQTIKDMVSDQDNNLTEVQRNLLSKILTIDTELGNEGKELKGFIDLITSTEIKTDTIYIIDSTGNVIPPPKVFADLPIKLSIPYHDEWNSIDITYDVEKDSLDSKVLIRNEFEIKQYEKDGTSMVDINNNNPFTYSLPGTNSFILDTPLKQSSFSVGLQTGIYITAAGKITPAAGIGLNYPIDLSFNKIKNIFKKK